MKWKAVTLLMMCLWGCSGRDGLTFRSPGLPVVSGTLAVKADRLVGAAGELEPAALIGLLLKQEVLLGYPASDLVGAPFVCQTQTRVSDIIRAVEVRMGWVYDPGTMRFYEAAASHTLDKPDEFGRITNRVDPVSLARRPIIAVSFRFIRGSAGVVGHASSGWTASGSAETSERVISFSVPDGVQKTWERVETRTYYDGTTTATASNPVTTNTLKQMSAGLTVSLLAARLPGDAFRMDGTFTVSSFTGQNLNQDSFSIPIQIDGPRHQWAQVFASEGNDKSLSVGINRFIADGALGGDNVYVLVRAD